MFIFIPILGEDGTHFDEFIFLSIVHIVTKNHGFACRRPPGSQRGQASSSRTCDVGRFGAICDQQKTVRSGLEMLREKHALTNWGIWGV